MGAAPGLRTRLSKVLPDDGLATTWRALGSTASVEPARFGAVRLLQARAVNGDGTIVGYGRYVATPGGPEVSRGFVLTVVP